MSPKHSFQVLILTAACVSSAWATTSSHAGYASPESVLLTDQGIFVSNVGEKLAPQDKDADGAISLVSDAGDVIESHYFDATLNAPKGMAVIGDTLYVTDIDRVVGLSLETRKAVFEVSLQQKGVAFLNDLAADSAGMLYVSATDTGDIFLVNPNSADADTQVKRLDIAKLPGPNGLAYNAESHTLWVASFGENNSANGEIGALDLATLTYTPLEGVEPGMFDGIVILDDSTLLVSDWVSFERSGKLKEIDIQTGAARVLEDQIGGPADFSYSFNSKKVYMPKMMEGGLEVLEIN